MVRDLAEHAGADVDHGGLAWDYTIERGLRGNRELAGAATSIGKLARYTTADPAVTHSDTPLRMQE